MHLHGHDMSVLHEGPGYWDGVSLTSTHNPQRRDVQMLRPGGHLVLQYQANNPGVWPFHCHIAWHVSQVCGIPASPTCFRGKLGDFDLISSLLFLSVMTNSFSDQRAFT